MKPDICANGQAPPSIDASLDARASNGSTKVVEKPDAGLRSQDHCIRNFNPSITEAWLIWRRQEPLATMALRTTPMVHSPGTLGNTIPSDDADSHALFSSRFLLLNYSQSGDPYLLHDCSSYTLLVRIYQLGARVCLSDIAATATADRNLSMVHILASGVFFSGFLKDLLCIPRPLSPPLQRITLSSSASLEYGFPSTHSTNAASVAVYALFFLHSPESALNPQLRVILQCLSYAYTTSIVLGRIYCGMHGFLDVIVGTALGASLSVIQCMYGDTFDNFINNGSFEAPVIVVLLILVLVRIHPEPADDCPCFDDSVAFAGVMIGVELGIWHYARSGLAWDDPVPATAPFTLQDIGWPKTTLRIVTGVIVIFAWREFMKPTLLRLLPPIFRVVEGLGLNLPRRFFKQASYDIRALAEVLKLIIILVSTRKCQKTLKMTT